MSRMQLFAVILLGLPSAIGQAAEKEPLFSRHVVPLFSRLGCNAGACHGAVKGQGGFRLTLFGADPALDHQRLLRNAGGRRLSLVIAAKDGSLKWKVDNVRHSHQPALGEDYFVVRGYGGHGIVRDLATGKPVVRNQREVLGGCPDHSCAPVLLTSGRFSYAVSSSGLYARDIDSGKIVWHSLGFAPRACTSPIAANGRLFYSPNVNNMLYCFEPVAK